MQIRRESVDALVDQLEAWLKAETKGKAEREDIDSLMSFVGSKFRRDLHNISIYVWHAQTMSGETNGESLSRLGLYLIERGWIKPEQLSEFSKPGFYGAGSEERIFDLIVELACQAKGLDPEVVRKAIPPLQNAKAFEKSLAAFVETTDDFKVFEKRMAKQKDQPIEPATGSSFLSKNFLTAFLWWPLFGGDTVDIAFDSPVEPLMTNGEWDKDTKRLTWPHGITGGRGEDKNSPTDLSFACWAKANQTNQQEQFGRVIFKKFELIQYCAWYDQLDDASQKKWEEILATLKPGDLI